MKHFIRRLFKLSLASALLGAVIYAGSDAFAQQWREFIVGQMAERGLHLDFRRLMLNPFGGLIARDVQIFADADRKQVLAAVDRLNLDFNFGKLMEKKFVVEGLDLSHASVLLPVTDELMDETVIVLEDLSARAFLHEGRLEVRQAEGTLSGIRLSITGELTLPQKKQQDEYVGPPVPPVVKMEQQMQVLRDHHLRIQRGLEWLSRFQFQTAPRLSLVVNGALDRPAEMSVRLFFEAEALRYGSYVCRELVAEAEYNAGLVDLTRLYLKDEIGQVNASASWRMGTPDLRFQMASSADLPGLAQTFLNSDNLREIVFYETPHLALNGVWYVDGPLAKHKRPVEVTGRLDCGRFSTRGAVFDGLEANIGVAPEGVYIRDLLLKHETGTVTAQALSHDSEGFRYRAVLRMDPNAFLPFAQMKQTREIISRFQFNPKSSIYFEVEGQGPKADLQLCMNQGRGELKDFAYRGVDLNLMEADVEFQGPIQHYRNARVVRPEGSGEVTHVHVDDREKWVRLEGVKSKIDPVAATSCFAPKVAEQIAKYRLPNNTAVELDGVIYYKDGSKSDFEVHFKHPTGTGRYALWGDDILISRPEGDLIFKGMDMRFDIRGSAFGEPMNAKGTVDLLPGNNDFSVIVKAGEFPYEIFGKKVPFTAMNADVASTGSTTRFDIRSSLLGGAFSLKGTLDESRTPQPYAGELRLEGVSFQRFASLYSKVNDTEGDITGHFRFAGRLNDWLSLKGGGAAIIVNGNLYAVPILGPLTPLLGSILPGQIKGYNVAKEANCTFEVADGYVMTENFEALTSVFKIALGGKIDFIRDAVDLNAQVRIRGLPGLVFMPFSELLEYRGEGSIKDTEWNARILKGTQNKTTSREPPTAANLREAERIAGEGKKPVAPEQPKRPVPLFDRLGGKR